MHHWIVWRFSAGLCCNFSFYAASAWSLSTLSRSCNSCLMQIINFFQLCLCIMPSWGIFLLAFPWQLYCHSVSEHFPIRGFYWTSLHMASIRVIQSVIDICLSFNENREVIFFCLPCRFCRKCRKNKLLYFSSIFILEVLGCSFTLRSFALLILLNLTKTFL